MAPLAPQVFLAMRWASPAQPRWSRPASMSRLGLFLGGPLLRGPGFL